MRVKFWGTRGSVPTPGRRTEKYGGNTTCVEVTHAGRRLVLDAGTGIIELGQVLLEDGPTSVDMLFSHFHWDHIQGLPFFVPFFRPDYSFCIHAPPGLNARIRKVLTKQMERDVFPVDFADLAARITFDELTFEGMRIGPFNVRPFALNHPGGSWAYRVEAGGRALVYATDNELTDEVLPGQVAELSGVHLLITDGQYTSAEYPQRIGWGHSAVERVVQLARQAGVHRLALTHHDPMRNDSVLSSIERETRRAAPDLDLFFARDGMAVVV